MKNNKKTYNIITSYTKTIVYFLFVCCIIICLFLMPKELITKDNTYTFCASTADVENSAVLLDYEVFGSTKRFEEALEKNSLKKLEELKEDGEILLVKIYGEEYKKTFNNNYWIVEDPNALELNIEYYIVTNIKIADLSLPSHTVYNLINDILIRINKIFILINYVLSFIICLPFIVSISKNANYIVVSRKTANKDNIVRF